MKNKIVDLRNHLFEVIESLKDKEKPMEVERAKAIADVAQVIVNSAKVEVDFIRATDMAKDTGFIVSDGEFAQVPGVSKITHKIR